MKAAGTAVRHPRDPWNGPSGLAVRGRGPEPANRDQRCGVDFDNSFTGSEVCSPVLHIRGLSYPVGDASLSPKRVARPWNEV